MDSEYCLRWKKYETNFRSFFSDLYQNEALIDVSLVTQEGSLTNAHRVVLSACSPYFQSIFKNIPFNHPHPVIVLKDVSESDLSAILCFMYKGYVNVSQTRVNGIIGIASSLQVKGLSAAPNQDQQPATAVVANNNNAASSLKPITLAPIIQEKTTNYSRALPHLRPSPVSQKRKVSEPPPLLVQENEVDGEKDYYGKPPPLHSQPQQTKFSSYSMPDKSPITVDVKLENMDTSFPIQGENQLDDSHFLDDSQDSEQEDGTGEDNSTQGFLNNSKTLDPLEDNLDNVDFVDDSDYSEALEFVQQDTKFLGEPSTSAGQHFMTTTDSIPETKPVVKKKGGSETRRFKCNTCGNQYNKYSHLNRHLQTHADPRFQCDKCFKLFVRKDVLRRHLIEVHNVVVQNCKIK